MGGVGWQLLIWQQASDRPVIRFSDHTAAVKAIAWSPHQHGVIASGGGTADKCIRFWNTATQTALSHYDTGSQVCNLAWSKNVNEIVSTHGYSLNQIVVWKYPTMTKVTRQKPQGTAETSGLRAQVAGLGAGGSGCAIGGWEWSVGCR